MNRPILTVFLMALALLLVASAAAQDDSPPPIEAIDCPFDVPAGFDVECSQVTVPSDYDDPASAPIQLPVVVVKARGDNPQPDPIIYLHGGPGGDLLEQGALFIPVIADYLENHDVVLFDQRGTGFAQPALDCPELLENQLELLGEPISIEEETALVVEDFRACAESLAAQGIDFDDYNSINSAADVEAIRVALGVEQWNVWGISYGTRLAQVMMRDYPDSIRSVILDSSYPLEENAYEVIGFGFANGMDELFAECAADTACNSSYPDLENVYFQLIDDLNENPIQTTVTLPLSGRTLDLYLEGTDVMALSFQALYQAEIIPLMPGIIYDVSNGDTSLLTLLYGAILDNSQFISQLVNLSVQCHEEYPFNDPAQIGAQRAELPRYEDFFGASPDTDAETLTELCGFLSDEPADPIETQPVRSDLPTLIMAGQFDPITPPSSGEAVAANLGETAQFIVFPAVGHGASLSANCPTQIAIDFFTDPAAELDTSCVGNMRLGFAGGEVNYELEPFTADAFGVGSVRPSEWSEVIPGTFSAGLDGLSVLAAPGNSDLLMATITAAIEIDEATRSTEDYVDVAGRSWTVERFEGTVQGVRAQILLGLYEADGTTYVVLVQTVPASADALYNGVFIPALEAFALLD